MAANNEVGTIQPVGEIVAIAPKALMFGRGAGGGRIGARRQGVGIDLMPASAHKITARKG
ncbi:MAG: hypothetical protein ACLRSW_12820 [Christensenellaceae bacterium]